LFGRGARVFLMKLKIDGKPKSAPAGSTIGSVLSGLGISPQVAIAKVNGTVRPESHKLREGDKVEIIKVVFGG